MPLRAGNRLGITRPLLLRNTAGTLQNHGLTGPERAASESASSRRTLLIDVGLLTLFALGLRLIDLSHAPDIDELHHVLAARSLLANGTLSITGGEPYDRALVFTYLIAGLFRVFGESLVVARMPAVIAGTAIIVVLFLWVRSVAGRTAGWIAAIPAAMQPNAIFLSQLTRFYTLQTLLFLVGTACLYRALTAPADTRARRGWFAAGAAGCYLFALHLQIITITGIFAACLWAGLMLSPAALAWLRTQRRARLIVAGALALLAVLGAALVRLGAVDIAVETFNYVDQWAADQRGNVRFYHWILLQEYPTAWTLFPVALIVAVAAYPRMGTLCGGIFAIAFTFHSLAAWKHDRYIAYAMPMFFAVIGLAGGVALPAIRRAAHNAVVRVSGERLGPRAVRAASGLLLAGCLLFLLVGNGAFTTAARMLAPASPDDSMPRPYRGQSDWGAAAATLRSIADSVDAVLGSSDLKSIYYLGRVDFILEAQRLYIDGQWRPEFTLHSEIATPAISTPESLQRIIECRATGLVVVEYDQWRQSWGVPASIADFLLENTEQILDSERWRIMAFRWDRRTVEPPADCPALLRPIAHPDS